jgi:malate synthase
MTEYINHGSLKVAKELDDLINKKVCVGIDIEPESFWVSFEKIIEEFTPRNKALI